MIRLALAVILMAFHAGVASKELASFIVQLFFALSGYATTLSIARNKNFSVRTFIVDRLIRIYPVYITCVCFAMVSIYVFGDFTHIHPWMILPETPVELVQNLTGLVDYPNMESTVIPQSWFIPAILFWNLLSGIGLFRDSLATYRFTILAAGLRLVFDPGYYSVIGGGVAYSLGASYFWLGGRIPRNKWMDRLSFPLFLCHYSVLAIVSTLLDIPKGWSLFLASLLPTIVLSWLIVRYIEQSINTWRLK